MRTELQRAHGRSNPGQLRRALKAVNPHPGRGAELQAAERGILEVCARKVVNSEKHTTAARRVLEII